MSIFEATQGEYTLSTDPARLDLDAILGYLTRSYWAAGRSREVMETALKHSLCLGLYRGADQVGLVRVITDFATFAYLCDVYVLETHQGHGLGKWLVRTVKTLPDLSRVRRWVLVTRDAHELYRQYGGFTDLENPSRWMEIAAPRPDQSSR
jgi:GNAT superfamily N-acetyltransferase